jgi:tetratricopeptide (TPR) repeat protein
LSAVGRSEARVDDPDYRVTITETSDGSPDVSTTPSDPEPQTPRDQDDSPLASEEERASGAEPPIDTEPQQPASEITPAERRIPVSPAPQVSDVAEQRQDTDEPSGADYDSAISPGLTQDALDGNFEEEPIVRADDLSLFEAQCRRVDADLAEEHGAPREDLLAKYGRTSASSGRFDVAAASYAMFLNEFGTDHPYSAQIAMRLGDCLAPLNLDYVDIVHTEDGPRFNPQWRMGFAPQVEWIRQAIAAYELAAELAEDDAAAGRALSRIGWLYRALGDWPAATAAWDRCADDVAGTTWAADALWLAAENLRWTGQPDAAGERLWRMAAEYADDARTANLDEHLGQLDVEAGRSPNWLAYPVASLQDEIEAQAGSRTPSEVYRSAVRWLRRKGEHGAIIAVSHWACGQDDWPVEAQIACRFHLVDALLLEPHEQARLEAVMWLGEIVDLASDDATAIPAAIRRYRLLEDLGRLDLADQAMDELTARVRGSPRWEPGVLTERIKSLLARGDLDRARAVLHTLTNSHPDYEVDKHIITPITGRKEEQE